MSTTTTDYTELAQKGQDQFLEAVKQSQQAIVDSVSAWSQTMQAYSSNAPPAAEIEQRPWGGEIIDNTSALVEKLVAGQREFARNLLAATEPARRAATSPIPAKPEGQQK